MIKNLETLSAAELGRLVNNKQITALEVIKYFEDRITNNNSRVNAFVYTDFEYAEQKAKEIDEKIANGECVGPFAGVPFGLKEFLPNKKGWKSWHGGVKCLESIDECDSVFCQAMEEAGGIAIGKTNAPAYGFRGTTDNKMFGPTSTPFNTEYNSGGSSGGSAAAVAAGLVPIAEGGDAGGSIRIPASFCNLFGFKAGVGSIPSVCRPDAWSATHPLCFAGGLVKTVEDASILFSYMSYYNPRDPYSLPSNHTSSKPNPKEFKIAYTVDFGLFEVDKEVKDKFLETINKLKQAGYDLEEVKFNFKHTANEIANAWCFGITIDCALDLNHEIAKGNNYLENNLDDFPEEFVHWKKVCDNLTIEDMYKFNLVRTDILDQFENVFDNYDLILSPTSCCPAVLNRNDRNTKGPETINGKPVETLIGWCETHLANFVGYPAASLPEGLLKNNLPIGMQVIGRRHYDEDVLQFSEAYEHINPWRDLYKLSY